MSKITHKQRISQIYPSRPEEKSPNSTHLASFVYYAQSRPAKLSKVVPYLERVILKDKDAAKADSVAIGLQILNSLIKSCSSNLNFFMESVIEIVFQLLSTNDPTLVNLATETFYLYSKHNNEQSYSNPSALPNYKRCLEIYLKLTKDSNVHLKKSGIEGLQSILIDQNMAKLETEATLRKVLPALFDAIPAPSQYPPQLTETLLASLLIEENAKIAVASLQNMVTRTTIFSLQWTIQALFTWLDEANKWSPTEFPVYMFQIILLSLHQQYYQALISEVLSRFDSYKGNSLAVKTSMVFILTHIISVVRDSVGVSVLELLDSLLNRLVGSLNIRKEGVTDEVGLHQAIIDSIGILVNKIEIASVKNECVAFLLKRMDNEAKKLQQGHRDEEVESQEMVLKRTFLMALDKISQTPVEVVPSIASFPTQASSSFYALLQDQDSGVRIAVQNVLQNLLTQCVEKYHNQELTNEQKLFLTENFGWRFHQTLYQTCLVPNVSPVDFLATFKTITTLLECFGPEVLTLTIPMIFKLQDESGEADGNPKQRGAHNLILQYMIFVAENLGCKDLLVLLSSLKNDRVENNQWLPSLDFQPGELKLMRGKSIKELDKKKKNKPTAKDTLIKRDKFFELLVSGRPSLKQLEARLASPFVFDETLSIKEEAPELAELPSPIELVLSSPRAPTNSVEAVLPSTFKNLLKDPFKHNFDKIAYVDLDSRESVVEFLDQCLPSLQGDFLSEVDSLMENKQSVFPSFANS